jgi:HEPN domain-containing protein
MDKKTEYQEWLKYADDDLETAELLNRQYKKTLNIICFHCHQAAEKYLKAFLISKNICFEKTHDLLNLNNLCVIREESFSILIKDCLKLNPYSVITRYPSELELIEQDALLAIDSVKLIKNHVFEKINAPNFK